MRIRRWRGRWRSWYLRLSVGIVGAGALLGVSLQPAAASSNVTLRMYTSGDTNVQSLWQNVLGPMFSKLHPGVKLDISVKSNGTNTLVYSRLAASVAAHKPSQFDLWDTGTTTDRAEAAHLLLPLTVGNTPNLKLVDPALISQNMDEAAPYRGSAVVLAFNSLRVKHPPRTMSALLAWIKANPGKFTYNTPSSGGSGDAFVQAIITDNVSAGVRHKLTLSTPYSPNLEKNWAKGLAVLKNLNASIYRHGVYPNGNSAVLQLLSSGAIDMAPVWSDMFLSYIKQGLMPHYVHIVQINPPFYGGPAILAIPKDSPHPYWARQFINWVLQPSVQSVIVSKMQGFPGIEWSKMPPSVKARYASIAGAYATPMSAQYDTDMAKVWQAQVGAATSH